MKPSSICPACNFNSESNFDTCPKCGVIVTKYLEKKAERNQKEAERQQAEREKWVAEQENRKKQQEQTEPEALKKQTTKKCPSCAMQIPKEANKCPYCRKRLGMTSLQKVLLVFVFLIFGLPILFNMFKSETPGTKATTHNSEMPSTKATTPPTTIETWNYDESKDAMTGEIRKYATKKSTNTVEFGFPYQGVQHGTIMLTEHSVLFYVQKGQVICQGKDKYGTCSVKVKFDSEEPRFVDASKIGDDSTTIRIDDSTIYENIMSRQKLMIEVHVYNNGYPVFTFDLGGLKPF